MNERGVITLDYLISLVLVSGLSFLIFALSLTLSLVETVQYVTFSSARQFFAADQNLDRQRENAALKYQSLIRNPAVAGLLGSGWYRLEAPTISSNIGSTVRPLADYSTTRPERNLFHGTVVYFVAKVLEFNVPFFGSTVNDELRGGSEFGSYIGSYLGREVTQDECENFIIQKWERIKALQPSGPSAYQNTGQRGNAFSGIVDNGC
jgi:hypothetical protein